MVTRSSTSIYILMRDNASRNRFRTTYHENTGFDDKSSLIGSSVSIEAGHGPNVHLSQRLPDVVVGYDELQYDFDRIRMKMREVMTLYDKHAIRPKFEDDLEEEAQIEAMTKDLTQAFSRCHRKLQQMVSQPAKQEGQLGANIHSSIARTLQEMSDEFRRSQSRYLRMLKAREEKGGFSAEQSGYSISEEDGLAVDEFAGREFSLQMVEDNTVFVQQHEQEVNMVLRSIQELNEIFSDIARLVVEQGEVIDRIDYNLEHVECQVSEGLKQLKKAEKYQKKNRKMIVILVLAVMIVILTILLVFTKIKR